MIKELFPLKTFHQDAVLKRLVELADKALSEEDIESGTIENARPVYVHPISIDVQDEISLTHVALLIFDNSNEEYNTYTKLRTKLLEIFTKNPNAVFPITGAIYYVSGNALHIAQKIGYSNNEIYFYTSRPDGSQGNFNISNYITNANIYDGVNKIN